MKRTSPQKSAVFILGIGSGIGKALAGRYLLAGHSVTGTYRHKSSVQDLPPSAELSLLQCDLSSKASVRKCLAGYKRSGRTWTVFISCVGTMEPIGKFFDCDFDAWESSLAVNSSAQLCFLHGLHPLRRKRGESHVVFLAGGGTNGSFPNYSAYCASKILLMKMCELLDDENPGLNVFIVGPGWVRTAIHAQTLNSRSRAGANYGRTKEFLASDEPGTAQQDIYDCINWCIGKGKAVSGGRNFSVVHDPWRGKSEALAGRLRGDPDKFKLRRFKNEG